MFRTNSGRRMEHRREDYVDIKSLGLAGVSHCKNKMKRVNSMPQQSCGNMRAARSLDRGRIRINFMSRLSVSPAPAFAYFVTRLELAVRVAVNVICYQSLHRADSDARARFQPKMWSSEQSQYRYARTQTHTHYRIRFPWSLSSQILLLH